MHESGFKQWGNEILVAVKEAHTPADIARMQHNIATVAPYLQWGWNSKPNVFEMFFSSVFTRENHSATSCALCGAGKRCPAACGYPQANVSSWILPVKKLYRMQRKKHKFPEGFVNPLPQFG